MYNKFNNYDTLRSAMLGTFFYPEFFDSIDNLAVRDPLKKIAHEINEDLDAFETILKSHGCRVIRATQPKGKFDPDHTVVPPLQVRNCHAVIGNTLFQLNPDFAHSVTKTLQKYHNNIQNLNISNYHFYQLSMNNARRNFNSERGAWYSYQKYHELAGCDWPEYFAYVNGDRSKFTSIQQEIESYSSVLEFPESQLGPIQGPNIINANDIVYVDSNEYCDYTEYFKNFISDRHIKQINTYSDHSDGCFNLIGPRLLVGIQPFVNYSKLFPGYEVISVPVEYQDLVDRHRRIKNSVNGRWWIDGEENNDALVQFVETYLRSWTGCAYESVFDVNVLMLDPNTVCVSGVSDVVKKEFRRHGIDCIVVPWRHRFFVDGGLHCITLDLDRR